MGELFCTKCGSTRLYYNSKSEPYCSRCGSNLIDYDPF